MELKNYISNIYTAVDPFAGINSVENLLLENQYLVIIDSETKYHGILTISDIIKRPHKLVIDCVTKKAYLDIDDTIASALEKFYTDQTFVLPVMEGSEFIGVIEKNHILRELEAKVNMLYNKSLISEKAKINFLKNLSHEIRSPLNIILGFVDIIAQLDANEYAIEYEAYSKTIRQTASHFLMIMNDLVELSLLYTGHELTFTYERVDIVEIFTELEKYFSEFSISYNRKTYVKYLNTESSLHIHTDGKKLKHILYHLIINAIKFTEDNKVLVGFEQYPNDRIIRFFVKNKSHNLAQKDLQEMFNIFEKQGFIGEEINFGLGIGLPLVKKLTELLGGQIMVETQAADICFWVSIPFEIEDINHLK